MLLTNIIKSYNVFTDIEIQKIRDAFVYVSYNPDAFLLQKGETSDKIFFITEGILREFAFSNLKEDGDFRIRTHWILGENEWIYHTESYILEKPSTRYKQALTPLKAFYIPKKIVESLQTQLPTFNLILLNIHEKYLLQLEHRNEFHCIKNAAQRLQIFEKMQPNLQNRVAGKVLASYLNVSPEQLSRLRGKRTHKTATTTC